MIVNRVRALIPAPKDAVNYYLVLSTNQLWLDGDNNWVGGNTFDVDVWMKKGEQAETQSGLPSFKVRTYADGTLVDQQTSRTHFTYTASKTVAKYDVQLIIDDKVVDTQTVGVALHGKDGEVDYYQLSPSHYPSIKFNKDANGTGYTPVSYQVYCGYYHYVNGVTTHVEGNVLQDIRYIEEKYFVYYRYIGSDGQPVASGSLASGWIDPNANNSAIITVSSNTTHSAIEFCMSSKDAVSQVSDSNIICQKTRILIDKDGLNGSNGGSGRGIVSQTAYYLATTLSDGVTRSTESANWTTSYQKGTADKPFVWRYIKYVWSSGESPTYSDCELIFTFNSGANPNLLDQTNFPNVASMTRWSSIGQREDESEPGTYPGSIVTGMQGHNAFFDGNSSTVYYKDMLAQYVYDGNSLLRLDHGVWYTLSFWAKGTQVVTYIAPDCIDTSVGCYVDNAFQTVSNDGAKTWTLSDVWVRHTFTFKTNSSFSAAQRVVFRILESVSGGTTPRCHLCMPKLEVGMQATSYISSDATLHTGQPRARRWAVNTQYFCGNVDEKYDDTVLVGEKGFYHCIKSHVSAPSNKPGSGSSWPNFWEKGSKINFLATEIFLAAKAIIKNLIASMVQTDYEGNARIEMEGSRFQIFGQGKSSPSIELAVDKNGYQVLRFFDQDEDDGTILYDLGPAGIAQTPSQSESNTMLTSYRVVGNTNNTDTNIEDVYDHEATIFQNGGNGIYTQIYKYAAKINAGVYVKGNYCATDRGARQADGCIFLRSAGSSLKYIQDIAAFTGLVVESYGMHSTTDPMSLDGTFVGNARIPFDYSDSLPHSCDFTVSNGVYTNTVYYITVYHYTNGKKDGSIRLYSNNLY